MSRVILHPRPVLPLMGGKPQLSPLAEIDCARLNITNEQEAIDQVIAVARQGQGATLFTLNLDHLVKLENDRLFREAYQRASFVTADGFPVARMARDKGARIERVTGADLVLPVARAAAEAGIVIHLFGTRPDVLERASLRLQKDVPGLKIVTEAPPMGFDPRGPQAEDAARRIAASGARICFVALGAPKQELFADLAASSAGGVVYLCIGAALDFLAGTQRRAPRAISNIGMEWAWRLVHSPRRLSDRYMRSAIYYLRYKAHRTSRQIATLRATLTAAISRLFN